MMIRGTDPAQHPYPQPPPPGTRQVQPPMLYVYERQAWEYMTAVRNALAEELPSEQELNEWGASGWELVGVAGVSGKMHFYFKRTRR
jgi:hypothetical protein